MARVGFIGTGHIAAPMARYLARAGHAVMVSERNADVAAGLAAGFEAITVAPNQSVIDGSEIVFLCVRPQHAEAAINRLHFRAYQQVVSVMAGVTEAQLRAWCAPATDISITIPLGYVEAGGCPLAVYPHGGTLEPLFGADNPVIPVASEAALNSHFAICALVPGILAMLETGADWLAQKTGDAGGAELYTTQLLAGFLATMDKTAGSLRAEKEALATEASLSLMMVEGLSDGGAMRAVRAVMDAIECKLNKPD